MNGASIATRGLVPGTGASIVTSGLVLGTTASTTGAAPLPPELAMGARVRGTSIIDITDRFQWNLTIEALATVGLDPIFPGEYMAYRHQLVDADGAGVSLKGAVLAMSLYRLDSLETVNRLFRRRSLDTISGWLPATKQLAIDSDQDAEDTDEGTGTGWWAMTFTPNDETLLAQCIGSWLYDVRARFNTGKVRTLLRGRIQISWPRSVVADFT